MKTLLKLVLGIVIFLIIIIGVPLGILYYNISDSTDNTPLDVYGETITFESVLTNLFNENLDLTDKDSIDFTFSEDDLNRLIFGLIKENVNQNYAPQKANPTDAEAYIDYTTVTMPVLGDRKVLIKSAYAELNDNKLEIYLTLDLLGVKSRAKLILAFEEDVDNYKIIIDTIGLGKMNLFSGLGEFLFNTALKAANITNDSINSDLEKENLPFKVDLDNQTIIIPKDEINLLLMQLINPEEISDDNQSEMMASFIDILTNKNNDLLNFGIINGKFGLSFDLTKFKVKDELANIDDEIKTFNSTMFMQSKVQGYILSTLTTMNDAKMYFTNKELNQIVYDQSNGYEAFAISIPLPNSTSTFAFSIEGILLAFAADEVEIRIIINLNGLTTSLLMEAEVQNNNTSEITLKIKDTITLGEDVDEAANEYVSANANLILSLLGSNIDAMGIMSYNASTKSLILNASSFTQMMAVDGDNVSPLTIDRLKIVNGGLEAYGEPGDTLAAPVATTSDAVKTALATNDFDESDFDTTDENEAEAVNNLLDSLDAVADGITNDSLTVEETNQLIANYNALSDENKEAFLEKLETNAASPELLDLYDSLFGK